MSNSAVRLGFTLAEVLVTLGIIGVVSAITMPVIVTKIQDRQNIAKWKKAYSVVSNAFDKVMSENIPICEYRGANSCTDDGASYLYSAEFIAAMQKELNVIDTCGNISPRRNPLGYKKCMFDGNKVWNGISGQDIRSKYGSLAQKPSKLGAAGSLNAYDFLDFAFLLADGTVLNFGGLWSGLTIGVDVNSAVKGPNQLGRDFFTIQIITKNYGQTNYLKPMGAEGTTGQKDKSKGSSGCSPDIGLASANAVYEAAGAGCAAKYLME